MDITTKFRGQSFILGNVGHKPCSREGQSIKWCLKTAWICPKRPWCDLKLVKIIRLSKFCKPCKPGLCKTFKALVKFLTENTVFLFNLLFSLCFIFLGKSSWKCNAKVVLGTFFFKLLLFYKGNLLIWIYFVIFHCTAKRNTLFG